MKIQINITGTKVALNTWTNATAKVGKKTYTIQMVVFEEGSEYGIEEGKISKLYVADADRNMIANYDRGWDVLPKSQAELDIVDTIIAKFN